MQKRARGGTAYWEEKQRKNKQGASTDAVILWDYSV